MLPSAPPKKIREPKIFWFFQGFKNGRLGKDELKYIDLHKVHVIIQITFVWKFYLSW